MHVKVLETIEYPPRAGGWRSTKTPEPTWAEVESAIRRLDRDRFPIVFLWPTTDESAHEVTEENELFQVVGGDGAYWLAVTADGYFERRLDDPEQGDEEVEVWESDQGYVTEARHVCTDVDAVLRAARHYAERGGFAPGLPWESPGRTWHR